jgi:hypothetical protein
MSFKEWVERAGDLLEGLGVASIVAGTVVAGVVALRSGA